MTSCSSPGISLKQEGISYIVGAELPAVIVNIVRGGPGLGGIQPAQCDYYQATRGGGHGDYRMVVLAPSTVQEAVELTQEAFDIADYYRNPVMLLGDGMIGQMMEPVTMKPIEKRELPEKTWAATGWDGKSRPRAILNSLFIDPAVLENSVNERYQRYAQLEANEVQYEEYMTDDADIVLVAFGITARICKSAITEVRKAGIKAGLLRPITLWPYPKAAIGALADRTKAFLSVEMSMGQMVDDVRLAVNGKRPVYFYGRTGGMIPSVEEVAAEITRLAETL